MSKPDDIPQDVWDAAELQVRRWPLATDCVPEVARAIMAAEKRGEEREREACAHLAKSRWKRWGHTQPDQLCRVDMASCDDIAAAIRKRGEA